MRAFEAARPYILGALLDAVSTALRNLDAVDLMKRPRMADFARWCVAVEPALNCEAGDFMRAYSNNRLSANDLVLEASPIAAALISFAEREEQWTGTAAELLEELMRLVGDERLRDGWPKSAKQLGGILKRLAPNLRAQGVDVRSGKDAIREGGTGRRMIRLELLSKGLSHLSQSSQVASVENEMCDKRRDDEEAKEHCLSQPEVAINGDGYNRGKCDNEEQAISA